ncbi:iron-containing alcohol dehydrogenase [Alkalicella caledoniensis]|uniref:Iron-containing alcohol dehydrogenase n=1 Tax=Alkalicella caledoniensis TaxID=2731377 RepID=A0A7G9WA27_ALKCA|nr:iron-containing alcohol dehydrogenase [Alkalicella caledoniensis]QNO15539.1 iron-containing alcohol dehydrogenase [Alkalicella caledoniensis]
MRQLRFHGKAIVTGKGSLKHVETIKSSKTLIITGKGSMFNNGTIDAITTMLNKNNIHHQIYSGVKANPTTEQTMDCVGQMKEFKPDTVIAVGGGSAIDLAKVATLFYEYNLDFSKAINEGIPETRKTSFIAIPSTSGTATEVTKAAVITFPEDNLKRGFKSDAFVPDIAILDPQVTLSMPKSVVAETGMDAMTHAVECFINKNVEDFTSVLAKGAIEGLYKYLPLSYDKGDIENREKVHNHQAVAGSAFTNVGLGMAHGISHAIGGMYDLGHGLINAVVLPYVVKFNSQDPWVEGRLSELDKLVVEPDFIQAIVSLNQKLNIPSSFKEMGIEEGSFEKEFDELVENSLKGSTRVNPVQPTNDQMEELLRNIYQGKL